MIHCWLIFIILFINTSTLDAHHYYFQSPSIKNDEIIGSVNDLIQDKRGFIYMATNRGLVRFDGSRTKTYTRQSSDYTGGLPGNIITSLFYDGDKILWVVSTEGICTLNLETERFQIRPILYNGELLSNITVYQLCVEENLLLLSPGKDVYIYNIRLNECHKIETELPEGSKRYAPSVFLDKKGIIWLGYANNGIWKANKNLPPSLLGNHSHTPLSMADFGMDSLIIRTLQRGIWIMSKQTGESRKVHIEDVNDSNIYANVMYQVNENEWWIGTENGIYILKDGIVSKHIQYNQDSRFGLKDNRILSLLQDSDGSIWIGTQHSGVYICPHWANDLSRELVDSTKPNNNDQHITAIIQDKNEKIWLGTDKGKITNGYPIQDFAFRNHEMWIATYTGGIKVVNLKTSDEKWYRKTKEKGSLKNNEVFCLCCDKKKRMWIGTTTNLFVFEPDTEKFHIIDGINSWINDLVIDNVGRLWIATRTEGLRCYDTFNNEWCDINFQDYNTDIKMPYGGLSCLYLDKKERLWIGTEEDGLYAVDFKNQQVQHVSSGDGLPDNAIAAIVSDQDERIWLSTARGITLIEEDTITNPLKKIIHPKRSWLGYSLLCNSEFSPRVACLLHSGELCFGSMDGIVKFHPHNLINKKYRYTPIITNIISPHSKNNIQDEWKRKGIVTLTYDNPNIIIELSAMDFESGNRGKMEYLLKGGRKEEWILLKGGTVIQFTDLHRGRYELYVRYATDGYSWVQTSRLLEIVVQPPWWQTSIAYIIYVLVTIIILYVIWKLQKLREEKKIQIKRHEWEVMKREEKIKNQVEFFTNVAHELRTPVSIIRASVERISNNEKHEPNLKRLVNSTDNLSRMIDELLDFRKVEQENEPLLCECLDINHVLNITLNSFTPLIESRKLLLKTLPNKEALWVCANEKALKTVITNLISNAVKYATSRIEISASIHIDDKLRLFIKNDCLPIDSNISERLFEPFVKGNVNCSSTGIGLAIVKLLTLRMKGNIFYEEKNGNITFCIELPLPKKNSDNDLKPQQNHIKKIADLNNDKIEKETILIVEDNDDLRNLLAETFSEIDSKTKTTKYKVITSTNGLEAWDILQNTEIDLVISDVMMPKMNGYELCQFIKSTILTCHIPIILLTAKNTYNDRLQGFNLGADAYIAKPFCLEELKVQTYSLLRNRKVLRNHYLQYPTKQSGTSTINVEHNDSPITIQENPLDIDFKEKLFEYTIKNLSEIDFNIDLLAEHMNMSRSNLHRKMRALFNCSPGDFVHTIRMQRAAELLKSNKYRVGEVSMLIGFNSVSHFSRAFRKYYEISPKNFGTKKED